MALLFWPCWRSCAWAAAFFVGPFAALAAAPAALATTGPTAAAAPGQSPRVGVSLPAGHAGNDAAQLALALERLALGDASGASEALARLAAQAQTPMGRDVLQFWRAEGARLRGDHAEVLALLTPLLPRLLPVADELQARRAAALATLGRPAEAVAAWQAVLRDWPHGAAGRRAAFGLPEASLAAGYSRGAVASLRRALARYPHAPEAPAARLALADAVAAHDGSAYAVAGWRACANEADAGVRAAAEARLARLAAAGLLAPPSPAERLRAIDAALAQRRLQAAAALWGEAVAAAPAHDLQLQARLQLRQGQLQRRQRANDAARATFAALARTAPSPVREAALREGASLALAGPTPLDAVPIFGQLAKLAGGAAAREAHFGAALAQFVGGDNAAAEAAFRHFGRRFPRDSRADEATWYAAWAAYRRGNLAAADDQLRALLRRWPHGALSGRAHYWRGRIAAAQGQPRRATAAYTAALADPSGYYALWARHRLAAATAGGDGGDGGDFRRPGADAALAGAARAFADATFAAAADAAREPAAAEAALAAWQLPPACSAATPSQQPASAAALADGGDAALAWQSPAGWRAAWLLRLGLARQAVQAVAQLPAAPHVPGAQASLARAHLLLGLGAFHEAMVQASALLGPRQGWPQAAAQASAASPWRCAALALAYPPAYAPLVHRAAAAFAVDPALILAIMRQESAFVPTAESTSAAHGLMQIMPQTGRAIALRLGVDAAGQDDDAALLAPGRNVPFGAWYLAALLQNYAGNVALAIGAYNAGPAAMDRWLAQQGNAPLDAFIENVPYRETRQYIKHVLVNLDTYAQLQGGAPLQLPERAPASAASYVTF